MGTWLEPRLRCILVARRQAEQVYHCSCWVALRSGTQAVKEIHDLRGASICVPTTRTEALHLGKKIYLGRHTIFLHQCSRRALRMHSDRSESFRPYSQPGLQQRRLPPVPAQLHLRHCWAAAVRRAAVAAPAAVEDPLSQQQWPSNPHTGRSACHVSKRISSDNCWMNECESRSRDLWRSRSDAQSSAASSTGAMSSSESALPREDAVADSCGTNSKEFLWGANICMNFVSRLFSSAAHCACACTRQSSATDIPPLSRGTSADIRKPFVQAWHPASCSLIRWL